MNRTEKDNYEHLYCFEHCKKNRRGRKIKFFMSIYGGVKIGGKINQNIRRL